MNSCMLQGGTSVVVFYGLLSIGWATELILPFKTVFIYLIKFK